MKTLLVLTMLAGWQPLDTPGWLDFVEGSFNEARERAAASNTADGLALACRSGLVIGGFKEHGSKSVTSLHRALDDCEKALALDPNNVVAGVSYAIGIGYEAKRIRKASYVKASKERLEALVARLPDDPLAVAAMGGWHSAVSNAGFLARLALGASRKEAQKYFERAIALDDQSVGTRFEYVRFLARGDKEERALARKELSVALSIRPKDAAEEIMLKRLAALMEPLESDDKKAAKNTVIETSAFDDIAEWDEIEPYPLKPLKNHSS
ncbi:hypothetical protein [Kordiimonas sp.]|uniref:hypothetical protein n=1 Tax=Kordiimonas sp. TaxID=1970157 RepID=UPI003A9437F6